MLVLFILNYTKILNLDKSVHICVIGHYPFLWKPFFKETAFRIYA